MNQLPVIIPPRVRDQIYEQMLFIARDSIDNALAWEDRLTAAIEKLSVRHGHGIDEDASRRVGRRVRRTTFERTYLIHYTVSEDQIDVVNFRHGSRLPKAGEP